MPSPDLQTVLPFYSDSYRPDRVISIAGGFSGAIIAKLISPAGDFSLRGWPCHSLPLARLLGLHRLLAEIHRNGITEVAVPVAALNSSTLVQAQGRYWQLEPWMPGEADFWITPSTQRLHDSMICLAGWHRTAAKFKSRGSEPTWFESRNNSKSPAVVERLMLFQKLNLERCDRIHQELYRHSLGIPVELCESILQMYRPAITQIVAELSELQSIGFDLQPCIRDLWHDHVLFVKDKVTGLIDLGACRIENVATDLARLLGSLVGDDQQAWESALTVYQQQRPLTPFELQLMRVLDRSSVVLSGMIWLDRVYLQKRQYPDPGRVIERLKKIRGRLERLTHSFR